MGSYYKICNSVYYSNNTMFNNVLEKIFITQCTPKLLPSLPVWTTQDIYSHSAFIVCSATKISTFVMPSKE